MVRSQHPPPLELALKVKVNRLSASLRRPILAHDGLYVGHKAQDIVKLSGERLEPEWRIPADGFVPWFPVGDLLLLESLEAPPLRAIHRTGELAWTLESRGRGWGRWRDRLYSIDFDDGRLLLADAATGQILERLEVQPRPDEVTSTVCGKVLLMRNKSGDPFRAYDFVERRFLWERDLLADMRATYGISDDSPMVVIRESGPGRFVAAWGKSVLGVSLEDGRLLWAAPVTMYALNVHERRVYVWAPARDVHTKCRLVCLDEETGSVVWDVPVEAYGPWPVGAVSDRYVAHTSRMGIVAVFRRSDGGLEWVYDYNPGITDCPVIAGNRLFVCGGDGRLLVFEGDL